MSGPYAKAARSYRAAGWSPLPLPVGKKKPPPAGWTGRGAQRASAADVEAFCEENPNGNVALWLHPGRIGIDVDAHKGAAEAAAWAALVERYGPLPEAAPWCSSRDDGVSGIRLLAVPGGYEAVTDLGPAGEVIQHFHRYVVAPPSIHPDTGQPYRWINLPEGRIPEAAHLPMLPASWLGALRAGGTVPGSGLFQQPHHSGWTNPDVAELVTGGVPSGVKQDSYLRDLVFECVRNGMSGAAVRAVWDATVARTPLGRPGEPWTDADFQRHYSGATRKTAQPSDGKHEGAASEQDSKDDRLMVKASNRNPVDIADQVAEHILSANDPPQLFSMSPAAVLLRKGALVPLDPDGWLLYVARRATFKVPTRTGTQAVAPPSAVMKLIPPVVIPELPPLDGIATTPYLDRDGNLVAEDGYHPGTRLLLQSGGFKMPAVSTVPSEEDVAQAVKLLTIEWLGDFPFASPADKANVIAVPLTMTGRMFFALVPLFVFDASTAGSGKGLLATTISLIATGEPPQVMELPADGEEQRKKITSALLAGHELIMWDESHVIQGRTLAAILTAEKYSDRLLGGNKLISVTNRFTQVALGNNVDVWGDMKRRIVPARLVPDTDHPEHRTDFRHPDLELWARNHRGELLAAVLTIWRNWIAKGRPEAPAGMGSFERWSRTVGGALQAAGIEGFRTNTADWLSDSDDDDGWGDHLRELRSRWNENGQKWFTVAAVADAIEAGHLKRPPFKRDPDKTLAQQIGYSYRKIRERWHGDLRLIRSDDRDSASGGRTWSVEPRRSQTPEPSSAWSGSSGSTDHPDHADDPNPDPQRDEMGARWPEGSIGEAASHE